MGYGSREATMAPLTDDQWERLVREAADRVGAIVPDWTDQRDDPGVAIAPDWKRVDGTWQVHGRFQPLGPWRGATSR